MCRPTLGTVAWTIRVALSDPFGLLPLPLTAVRHEAFPHAPMLPHQPQQDQFTPQPYQAIQLLFLHIKRGGL
jgi:hypothetical protein